MKRKNWIEFDNQENKYEEKFKLDNSRKISKINVLKQKKVKKGRLLP